MKSIQSSTIIHQPVEKVFGFFVDSQKQPLWQPDTLENGPVTDETGKNLWRNKARGPAGLTLEVVQETTECVPNQRLVAQSREAHGWITSQSRWDFESVADGTLVTVLHEVDLHGWVKCAGPIFVPLVRNKVAGDLVRMKKLLEA